MATVTYNTLLPEVLPFVEGCPEPLAVNAIRNSAIKLCDQTLWWQMDYGTVSIATAGLPYTLVAPPMTTGTRLAQIMFAYLTSSGQPLAITSIDELNARVVGWRSMTGQPQAIFQSSPGIADFYPRPAGTDAYSVSMRVAMAPTRASTGLDSSVVEKMLEIIAAGALARLLALPNKQWSDEKEAARCLGVYEAGVITHSIEAAKSFGRQSRQIQMRSV